MTSFGPDSTSGLYSTFRLSNPSSSFHDKSPQGLLNHLLSVSTLVQFALNVGNEVTWFKQDQMGMADNMTDISNVPILWIQ